MGDRTLQYPWRRGEEGIRQLIQRMLANASIREVSGITGYSEEEINRILKT